MEASSRQQGNTSLVGNMKSRTFVKGQKQGADDGNIRTRRKKSVIDSVDYDLLPEGNKRQVRELPKSHSIQSIVSGETTQADINEMVSQCFAANCGKYYSRCCLLEKLIEADDPADDTFMGTMNSGPMYPTDCCNYLASYVNKFKRHCLVENTALSDPRKKIVSGMCPPMDIYERVPLMDLLSECSYIVAEGGKATEALSALKNKFSIIDCGMLCEIAYYEVILLLMGEKNFNRIFARDQETPFLVSTEDTSLVELLMESSTPGNAHSTQESSPSLTIQKGVIYYFSNHRDYKEKHPFGVAQGMNTMLVKKSDNALCFTAFGFDECGLSPHEINKELVALFNRPAVDDFNNIELYSGLNSSTKYDYDKLKDKIITLDEFYANGGGFVSEEGDCLDVNSIGKTFGHLVADKSVDL